MRQIKFRGLTEGGKWVYGDLIQTKPNKVDGDFTCWIKERSFLGLGAVSTPTAAFIEVETKTVGQLTGLTDKNGVEIYEGDIVKHNDRLVKSGVVSLTQGCWMSTSEDGDRYFNLYWHLSQTEIIGNIHQNPELLEQNDE